MMVRALDVIQHFAPTAKAVYLQAFADPDGLIAAAQIDRPLRLAHFMAQCLHETGGGTILVESGRYSAKNLGDMWDAGNWHRYFRDRDECVAMARQCQIDNGAALFSRVYGNRMGNGGPETQDGWTYRGRGVLQTTGRGAYRDFGARCGVDFEGDPGLVIDARHALKPALLEWMSKNVNGAADHDDIEAVTLAINGGLVGLKSRRTWFARILPFVLGQQPVEQSSEWRVQVALTRAGYDAGPPDGVVGARSRLAIIAYRADHGLAPGPQIADDLLTALGV
jgi:putative chitinase